MSTLRGLWACLSALLLLSTAVSAAMIRIEVTGTVQNNYWSSTAYPQAGVSMNGYCIYNSDSPDTESDSYYGSYKLEEVFMQVGNLTFQKKTIDTTAHLGIGIGSDFPYTIYAAGCADATVSQNGILVGDTSFTLFNFTKSGVNSPIPDTASINWPADILSWNNYFKGFYSGIMFDGEIESFNVIPEPMSLILLAAGSLWLRKQQRR